MAASQILVDAAGPHLPQEVASAVIDLGSLAPPDGFTIIGDVVFDYAGFSVSDAGDVDGDGFDDIIIGAINGDNGGTNTGQAYVIFGKAAGFANIDLSSLGAAGFIIQGDATYDTTGHSVSSAGDVNGDGFDDVIVGAPNGDNGGDNAGEAYVIFGKAGGFTTIDLSNIPAGGGFVIQGDVAGDRAGWSVSSAGDVNNDGFDDIIISAILGDDGGADAGEAYVIFGKPSGLTNADIDLTNLGGAGYVIRGDAGSDQAGFSLSSAGDINGDGFDDVIIGANYGDDGGTNAGEAYVIFGKASGFLTIDLGTVVPADGFVIQGDATFDFAGASASLAGDVNGDGFDDIIIGATRGDNGGVDAGEAYVIFGKAGAFGVIDGNGRRVLDLTALAAADGFIIQGDAAGDYAGFSVSAAGDFNGDGFDDIIVGAPLGDDGGVDAGAAYVVFGKAAGFGTIDLAALDSADGIVIHGDYTGDRAGSSVSSAGDVNGDGFDDVIVGAPRGNDGGPNAGEAYVIFGRGGGETLIGTNGADSLVGGAGDDSLKGKTGNDTLQGNGGGDTLDGGDGTDWADYRAGAKVRADLKSPGANTGDAAGDVYLSIENLRGSNGKDKLCGDDLANRIEGRGNDDLLVGRGGKDSMAGGAGWDTLTGGGQNDRFELASILAADADTIVDFAGGDKIALDSDVFGLPEGALPAGRFVVGNNANDANDRLIYNAGNGKLFFDADGDGAQAQVLIATLTGAPTLAAGDFIVI